MSVLDLWLQAFCKVAESAFRLSQYDMAFAIARAGENSHVSTTCFNCITMHACGGAGVHKQGISNERLCKRYLLFLEQIVKARASSSRKEGPPKMLYLRELFGTLPFVLLEALSQRVR